MLDKFTAPVLLGETEALVNLAGTITVVPQLVLSKEKKTIHIDSTFTPSLGITLEERGSTLLNTNEAYIFASIFMVFALFYIVEGSRYGGDNAVEEEMQTLLENHTSLQSSYTRKSILEKYRQIDKEERKKREVINNLSRMIFKGSTLTSFSLNEKGFSAKFACSTPSVSKRLQSLAKKKKFNISKIAQSNDLKIEGTL